VTAIADVKVPIENLRVAYRAALSAAGMRCDEVALQGVGEFVRQVGTPADWAALPLAKKRTLSAKCRAFVSWLLVTGRLPSPVDYLVAAKPRLGVTAARHHPGGHARFVEQAAALAFSTDSVTRQWNVLAQIAALGGVEPHEVNGDLLDEAEPALRAAFIAKDGVHAGKCLSHALFQLRRTLFHGGVIDVLPRKHGPDKAAEKCRAWAGAAPQLAATAHRYLEQIFLSLRPATVAHAEHALRDLAMFCTAHHPEITRVADLRRPHLEAFKTWLADRPSRGGGRLHRHTIAARLGDLRVFFERITEWGWDDAPADVLLFSGDIPIHDDPLPRFVDDAAAAKLLRAARSHPDPFIRLAVELLSRTGLRRSELVGLTLDAVVQIGSAWWLRVPVGKLHNDRYIPLHPQLKDLLDDWVTNHRSAGLRSALLFVDRNGPVSPARVNRAVAACAEIAGVHHVTPHQLRHTLATQAINRGMSLEAIAALLGHRSLRMTLTYARIADRTVANEYFSVTEKVEALYEQPPQLPADAEGAEMRKLRAELHRRMLGNGYCARPVEMDCHFESICESCAFFVTTIEFHPTLQRQRDDAAAKGQEGRRKIFDGLLQRLEEEAS
jgi:integrase